MSKGGGCTKGEMGIFYFVKKDDRIFRTSAYVICTPFIA